MRSGYACFSGVTADCANDRHLLADNHLHFGAEVPSNDAAAPPRPRRAPDAAPKWAG
jgi:hypothetical protein